MSKTMRAQHHELHHPFPLSGQSEATKKVCQQPMVSGDVLVLHTRQWRSFLCLSFILATFSIFFASTCPAKARCSPPVACGCPSGSPARRCWSAAASGSKPGCITPRVTPPSSCTCDAVENVHDCVVSRGREASRATWILDDGSQPPD